MALDKETIARVLHANYAAAAELLMAAANELAEAAEAAKRGDINLAVGTSLTAATAMQNANRLTEAANTVRQV